MVSHQSAQQITQASLPSIIDQIPSDLCPKSLIRAETAFSERQHPEPNDVPSFTPTIESSANSKANSLKKVCSEDRDANPTHQIVGNLFNGSKYWEKVARNNVYPPFMRKWGANSLEHLIELRESCIYRKAIERELEMKNPEYEYDDSECFDCDTSAYEMSQ